MTKNDIKYKSMADYDYNECGFCILFYNDKWSWAVLPFDIIETKRYVYDNLNKSIIDILPFNLYNYKEDKNTKPEEIAEELLRKGLSYSEELTQFLSETGYQVYWFN